MIVPGVTLCSRFGVCGNDAQAELVEEHGRALSEPVALCFDCIEDELEREQALAISPKAVATIAAARLDPSPLPEPWRPVAEADQSKLVAIRRQWLTAQGKVGEDALCHALRPDGLRCVRAAVVDGYLCHLHAEVGGRVPGLGWRDGRPCGNLVPIRRPA